jgi:Mechanosensitive ion channel
MARQRLGKVRARARPWRSIIALAIALVAAAVSVQARAVYNMWAQQRSGELLDAIGRSGNLALAYGAAIAFFLLASFTTISLGNAARGWLQPSVGTSHAAVVRFAVLVVAGLITIVVTMELCAIPVTQLVVGGALTGVLVGIAAQQSLANVFAGIVLLMARPFRVGDQVGIRSGALSGLLEGTVSEVSVTYVRLETPNGPVHVPNSQVLAAAVGPAGAVPSPTGAPSASQSLPAPGPGSAPPATGTPPPGPGPSPADAAVVAAALADEQAQGGRGDQQAGAGQQAAGEQAGAGQQAAGEQAGAGQQAAADQQAAAAGEQAGAGQQAQSGQQAQDARPEPPAPPSTTQG